MILGSILDCRRIWIDLQKLKPLQQDTMRISGVRMDSHRLARLINSNYSNNDAHRVHIGNKLLCWLVHFSALKTEQHCLIPFPLLLWGWYWSTCGALCQGKTVKNKSPIWQVRHNSENVIVKKPLNGNICSQIYKRPFSEWLHATYPLSRWRLSSYAHQCSPRSHSFYHRRSNSLDNDSRHYFSAPHS